MFPHEQSFARCFFLGIRALDAWTNTPHEGTNSGLKRKSENAVRPDMSQAHATKVMSEQDLDRTDLKRLEVAKSWHKTPLHSKTPTSQHVQKEAESMLQDAMDRVETYISVRIDTNTWWVLYYVLSTEAPQSPIPVVRRVRVVTRDENGVMRCSCGAPHHYGMPDSHIAHVAVKYGINFKAFTHHDLALRNHNNYCMFVGTRLESDMTAEEKDIRRALIQARQQESGLPSIHSVKSFESRSEYAVGTMCTSSELTCFEDVYAAISTLYNRTLPKILNYSDSDVEVALDALANGYDNAAGYTEVQHNCEHTDEPITFPDWDAASSGHSSRALTKLSAHAQVQPIFKEYSQVMEKASANVRKAGLDILNKALSELKAAHVADTRHKAPTGSIVSGKLKSTKSSSSHMKQKYYPGQM